MQLSRIRWCMLAIALAGPGCSSAELSGSASGGDAGNSPVPDAPSGGSTGAPDAPGTVGAQPAAKRGIAYGFKSAADLSVLGPTIAWWYNWADKPDTTALGPDFIPMTWNGSFTTAGLTKDVPASAKYILAFNEPNFVQQADMTPEAAAARWPELQAFAQSRGMKLVSPAVNYCGGSCIDTDPFDWLARFFAACTDCQVDYVAMHWYACDKPALTNTLAKYEQQFHKQLWVTELACLDTASKVDDADELAYMKDAVDALEADPMVFRYAWFTGRSTGSPPISLLGADGQLTALGAAYVAQPAQ
jgi:hypothetical protein